MELENQFLKTPVENLLSLEKSANKTAEKDLSFVLNGVQEIFSRVSRGKLNKDDTEKTLTKLISRVQVLKRKLKESREQEMENIIKCKARIEHLKDFEGENLEEIEGVKQKCFHKTKCDRLLLDYLLRGGYENSAQALAKELPPEFLDTKVFSNAKAIITSLESHSTQHALLWCAENRARLSRLSSDLEFSLRVQDFIELLKKGQRKEALEYAQKALAPYATSHFAQVKPVMGLLLFDIKSNVPEKYNDLLGDQQWKKLVISFKCDYYALHGIKSTSPLFVHITAGIATMNTVFCEGPRDSRTFKDETEMQVEDEKEKLPLPFSSHRNPRCPTCDPNFSKIRQVNKIPLCTHAKTALVCRISGKLMEDDNIPMALPNGNVYSKEALLEIAAQNNNKIIDPQTFETFTLDQVRKIYIV